MAKKLMVAASSSFSEGEAFEAISVDVSDSDWEVIDPSQSDDDCFSYDEVTTDNEDDVDVADADGLVGSPSSDTSLQPVEDEVDHHRQLINYEAGVIDDDLVGDPFGYQSSDISMPTLADEIGLHRQLINYDARVKDDDVLIGEGDVDRYDEDDDDYDDDHFDLDDELVPKWVNDRFERQRIRKLGKRAYPRMNKSKKMAYQLNRPGCVHGKHGLGLEHNLVC